MISFNFFSLLSCNSFGFFRINSLFLPLDRLIQLLLLIFLYIFLFNAEHFFFNIPFFPRFSFRRSFFFSLFTNCSFFYEEIFFSVLPTAMGRKSFSMMWIIIVSTENAYNVEWICFGCMCVKSCFTCILIVFIFIRAYGERSRDERVAENQWQWSNVAFSRCIGNVEHIVEH